MMGVVSFSKCSPLGDDLLGLADYYEAVLDRSELDINESEFRSNKLSLIVDLIRTFGIPDDLVLKLTVAVIDAWKMAVPESSADHISEERHMVLHSLTEIRNLVRWAKQSPNPDAKTHLDMAVQLALPMRSSDLLKDGAPEVHDLLSEAFNYLARENRIELCRN